MAPKCRPVCRSLPSPSVLLCLARGWSIAGSDEAGVVSRSWQALISFPPFFSPQTLAETWEKKAVFCLLGLLLEVWRRVVVCYHQRGHGNLSLLNSGPVLFRLTFYSVLLIVRKQRKKSNFIFFFFFKKKKGKTRQKPSHTNNANSPDSPSETAFSAAPGKCFTEKSCLTAATVCRTQFWVMLLMDRSRCEKRL